MGIAFEIMLLSHWVIWDGAKSSSLYPGHHALLSRLVYPPFSITAAFASHVSQEYG